MTKKKLEKPLRDPDYYSKRGVAYWWAPEWIRGTDSTNARFGKIYAGKDKDGIVKLYMKSKDSSLSYIRGSIQAEFQRWHTDRQIDYILLGIPLDEIIVDDSE